ncbi:CRISPR-associated endonuclease Cas1 [Pectobacterium quasiaquaticum]|uniref:CRISPR-associated endonuclease Cas1 n=1 Tax=Pectobacterium quasiaquaticum TaxID=2774015 RepID=UPI0018742880|nr:CRISPR-associated endonuclease Cas1 [Pectobacterium quasiaquaticum]URG53573.1 CRISPR-associated endonuclease Cas1 [Pectobacterium quasiaquaticum]
MTTLVLDRSDYHLMLQQGLLHLSHPERETRLLPLGDLERIVMGAGITLNSDLLLKLAELGIELIAIGRYSCAHLFNPQTPPNALRLMQYQLTSQEACRAQFVRRLIIARREGQNQVLRRLHAAPLPPLPDDPVRSLMLDEAHLSHHYWQAWRRALPESGFQGRQRQPPGDPINALLSLSSTLEDQALIRPLLAEGFDINLGLHHSTGYRRHSLLLDIKELTRATLEQHVLDLWQHRTLTAEHFDHHGNACRLTAQGQQIFYTDWFSWLAQRRRGLRRLARLCRRLLEREARYA